MIMYTYPSMCFSGRQLMRLIVRCFGHNVFYFITSSPATNKCTNRMQQVGYLTCKTKLNKLTFSLTFYKK